jgi:cytochrome b6-f complex iron-sulfur subunit
MADEISRRKVVRIGALAVCAPALSKVLSGCARRIDTERSVDVPASADGRVTLSSKIAPELSRPGGAIVIRTTCSPHPVLVANTGNGYLALQADCPHAACTLAWVEEDRQAECPCHLSRFSGDGTVLQGPATTNLQSFPADADAQGNVVVHLFAGDTVFPPVANGQVVFSLADHPTLQSNGGVVVGHPDGLPAPMVVTRDSHGSLHAMTAACTHQQCTVQPAPGEVLHCPCHGSVFQLDGNLSSPPVGPANSPLPQYDVAESAGTVTVTVGVLCGG